MIQDHLLFLELVVLGDALIINGVLVYDHCPPAVIEVVAALRAQTVDGLEPPLLSAIDLAQRTGRTPAALAQVVHRFRIACGARLRHATGRDFDKEIVIQGRPGYRLNPANVAAVRIYPGPRLPKATERPPSGSAAAPEEESA
jgi:hypothetical protein